MLVQVRGNHGFLPWRSFLLLSASHLLFPLVSNILNENTSETEKKKEEKEEKRGKDRNEKSEKRRKRKKKIEKMEVQKN